MDTKNKLIKTKGIIIKEEYKNEYDKLLTILTCEYGKIKVYSFGSRKQNSINISKTRIFCSGIFELKIVKNIYNFNSAIIKNDFNNLTTNIDNMIYASYFLNIIDYFSYENIDGTNNYLLLVYALKALIKNKMKKELIKSVFELKILVNEGIYINSDNLPINTSKVINFVWDKIINDEYKNIFSFNLKPNFDKEFIKLVENEFSNKTDNKFKELLVKLSYYK